MLIDLLLNGIVQGSLLALVCIGYSLAYGSAKVINFAHADVLIAGGGYLVLLWLHGVTSPEYAPLGMVILFGMPVLICFWPWNKSIMGRKIKHFGFPVFLSLFGCVVIFFLSIS